MLIGLFGGTFDPVHYGHVNAATAVKQFFSLDEVRMVMNSQPAHKASQSTPIKYRWEMLCLACAATQGLVADDTELRRGGRSFTFDTLQDLRQQNPDTVLCWIVGEDAFATLPTWYRWREILSYCNFIVLNRPGQTAQWTAEMAALRDAHECNQLDVSRSGQIVKLELPMLEMSSTDIRRRLVNGEPVQGLISPDVADYIRDNGLYDKHSTPQEALA